MSKEGITIAKHKESQKFILKINSKTVINHKYDYNFNIKHTYKNFVSLSSSQILRFIDEIEGKNTELKARELKQEIKKLKQLPVSDEKRKLIAKYYDELYINQYEPNYVEIVMNSDKDYDKINKGFKINGISYKRLLGTTGGIKNSTIIYISEKLYPIIYERIQCGRNLNKEVIPSKLQAYMALICSGSIPVSMPKGIIVVNDCYTHFKEDYIMIDDIGVKEPNVSIVKNGEIELDESDGYGLMSPELAKRWCEELGESEHMEILSGVNMRGLPFSKGILLPFDFKLFAEKVVNNYMIKDAWGDWRDVREAEVILTTSQLKLWDSYSSWEDFFLNVQKYNYQFAIAKTAPAELDEVRTTNYQFLQSYRMSDEDLSELISPTVNEFNDVIYLDYAKTLLFLKGMNLNEKNVWKNSDDYDFVKALLIEPKILNDDFVRSSVKKSLRKRINDAKMGVIKVEGNYAIIGGDPYSLCQSMFGLPVTGLLKAGECYHKFWSDKNVKEIACFRAPMTNHNNIRKLKPVTNEDIDFWYQYINTCMLLNSWDSTCDALNGADKDGDIFFTTNNRVLIDNLRPTLSIHCVQKKGKKVIPTEADFIESDKNSFGDAIGKITNDITSQIDLQASFPEDSEEYKVLDYRILCGQHYQQNAIDKAKGIEYNPMPDHWCKVKNLIIREDDTEEEIRQKKFNSRIVANKKPFFFIYNYPSEKEKYNRYIKTEKIKKFATEMVDDIDDREFFQDNNLPVNTSPSLMNRLSLMVSDSILKKKDVSCKFDTSILYDKDNIADAKTVKKISDLYKDYRTYLQKVEIDKYTSIPSKSESYAKKVKSLKEFFLKECQKICPDETQLYNTLIHVCYSGNKSKTFCWQLLSNQIINHLLKQHDYKINFPVRDDSGSITYCGKKFSMKEIKVNVNKEEGEED